jgi:hypothetical protein
MADITLHKYEPGEKASAINAPHKYRIAKKSQNDTAMILRLWELDKKKVLNEFTNALKERFKEESVFVIACAPSNTTHFINDMKEYLQNIFPNSIDISNCFSKNNSFEAGIINKVLTIVELRDKISFDIECFRHRVTTETKKILLIDDVYSLGNTFNAMKLHISEMDNTIEIVTATLLKTN